MIKLLFIIVFIYPFAQFILIQRTEGWWKFFSALPVLPMIFVILLTIEGLHQEANLWPIGLLFSSPIAVVYLGLFYIIHKKFATT